MAGTLLPQADQIDIPEFAHLTRILGDRRDTTRWRLQPWELCWCIHWCCVAGSSSKLIAEALGQIPVYPALACIAALKSVLPENLPRDTYALIDEIQAELEARFGIPGQTAVRLGMRVLSKHSVSFLLRGPITRETAPRCAELIAAAAHDWRLTEVGMADPNPSTPEMEALTDLMEEALLQRGLTVQMNRHTRR